ncbi:MAG: hypothetical protein ACTSPV_18550 [Candidatus Hodarchaeales archaeon]
MTPLVRRHILIKPNFDPDSFIAIATKLGCEEIHLFEEDTSSVSDWETVADKIRCYLHIHKIGGSVQTISSIITENVEGLVEKYSLVAISLDSRHPIYLIDAIWQTIVELSTLHRDSDSLGRLSEPITGILYSLDCDKKNLLIRPIYPFWDFRFLSIIQTMKNLPEGGTKKDMLNALDDFGIPYNIDKITKILLPLQNWLGNFEGFDKKSCRIDGKRTNFYKLSEIYEYELS